MNMFYDEELSKTMMEIDEVDDLIARVNQDPSVLDTLSLAELCMINRYYEEAIRKKKAQISALRKRTVPNNQ